MRDTHRFDFPDLRLDLAESLEGAKKQRLRLSLLG
jgi:hypothetical protein